MTLSSLREVKSVALLYLDAVMLLSFSSKISLELNYETVDTWEKVNCTTMIFTLINVRRPLSFVRCRRHYAQRSEIVGGLDLRGGRMYSSL